MKNKKIALVTGAANGIGKSIVEKFINEDYFVVAIDIDERNGELLVDKFGLSNLFFVNADISNEREIKDLVMGVLNNYHKIDVLVNNAGVIRDNLIWNTPVEDFDLVLNINLKGTWLLCKEVAKIMKEQKFGRIINIASRAWLGNRGQSNYSASKAGVIALTRVLALELGRYNVCVNAVAPGLINTPLTKKLSQEVLRKLIEAQPTRAMGEPEDVANVVSFLASEKTNFITGQTIYVDGGKSIGAGI